MMDFDAFTEDVACRLGTVSRATGTVDNIFERYRKSLAECVGDHARGISRKQTDKKKCPWYCDDMHVKRQAKRQAERKWCKSLLEIGRCTLKRDLPQIGVRMDRPIITTNCVPRQIKRKYSKF